jgi:hypothetical protein
MGYPRVPDAAAVYVIRQTRVALSVGGPHCTILRCAWLTVLYGTATLASRKKHSSALTPVSATPTTCVASRCNMARCTIL